MEMKEKKRKEKEKKKIKLEKFSPSRKYQSNSFVA